MNETIGKPGAAQLLEVAGAWPFVSRRVLLHPDQTKEIWESRKNRKQPAPAFAALSAQRHVCSPAELNWWIATVFALGAALFAVGSLLILVPSFAHRLSASSNEINAVFFAGSIPFTIAAYLQLFQAANAPDDHLGRRQRPGRRRFFGWRVGDIGWLSCALQFPGTVLFNFNTFDAMIPGLNWWQQELEIWLPNFLGSIFFLASGYLAFAESCHRHLAWKPRELSWWVTFMNFLGCISFMASAVFGIVLPGGVNEAWITLSVAFTLLGAICFFVGSLLMLPETA